MNNEEHRQNIGNICEYFNISTEQINNTLYNIISIETDNFDSSNAKNISQGFAIYYESLNRELCEYMLQTNNTVLDLSNVKDIDNNGIDAILFCNRMNKDRYEGQNLILKNCPEVVERKLVMSGMKVLFDKI
jgi:hypothetical protein